MKNEFKVDFLGIGAAKSGTTWLADMLRQHPQIFLPEKKELDYFSQFTKGEQNSNFGKPVSWYASFFKRAGEDQLKGEISPSYLSDDVAATKILEHNPQVKLIAILRNPIDRAYSHYFFHLENCLIDANSSFEEAIQAKPPILTRGEYVGQLKKYTDLFPKEHIQVIIYDDLKTDPKGVLEEVERFLGVSLFIPKNIDEKSNVTRYPQSKTTNKILRKTKFFLIKIKMRSFLKLLRRIGLTKRIDSTLNKEKQKPPMDQKTKEMLKKYYAGEIRELGVLLDRDLSGWLK